MGSSFFGKPKMGSDRRNNGSPSSSSSSSKKNKKGHVDKPKQPQRGLGVAQLEKLRLHEEMERCCYNPNPLHTQGPFIPSNFTQDVGVQQGTYPPSTTSSSISYGFQQNIAMGRSEFESANMCWLPSDMNMLTCPTLESVQYGRPSVDRQFIDLNEENRQGNRRNISDSSFWLSGQNSSDDQEEVDLELRL